MISEKESELLKKWLPNGALTKLAGEIGLTVSLVSKVLDGKRNNEMVLSRLIKIALKNKKKIEKTTNEIQKLAS